MSIENVNQAFDMLNKGKATCYLCRQIIHKRNQGVIEEDKATGHVRTSHPKCYFREMNRPK